MIAFTYLHVCVSSLGVWNEERGRNIIKQIYVFKPLLLEEEHQKLTLKKCPQKVSAKEKAFHSFGVQHMFFSVAGPTADFIC